MTGFVAYLEDAPLAPQVLGGGLARVNAALLKGLSAHIARTVLLQMHGRFPEQCWDEAARRRILAAPEWVRKLMVASARAGDGPGRAVSRAALRLIARPVRPLQAEWLFAPIGTDAGTAERAAMLARASGLRLMLYLVDDIEAAQRAQGLPEELVRARARHLREAVQRADVRFAITQALADRLGEAHGVPYRVLPLPYAARPVEAAPARSRQVVHIGAINHIYAPGLLTTAAAIGEANREGAGITLRLTGRPEPALRGRLEALAPLEVRPASGEGALEELLAASLCAIVPVEHEPSGMYATSFPSKLLEYLNACRQIIVLGPPEASAARYFAENGLGMVAAGKDELVQSLIRLAKAPGDESPRYQASLARTNAPEVVARQILDAAG